MNNKQLVGTAFEYANISTQSIQLANGIQQLLQYLLMYDKPTSELKTLTDAKELLTKYHFEHSYTAFEKAFNL